MPELPEVETVRRGVDSSVVGKVITDVEVGRERSVRRVGKEAVINGLRGGKVIRTRRHAKYLMVDLDNDHSMMIHLRMSGRLILNSTLDPRLPHTHVVMHLASARGRKANQELRFVDPRTFGEVVVYPTELETEIVPEISALGVDPINSTLDPSAVHAVLRSKRAPIKAVLLSQRPVSGIGNIYADEILHRSHVHPRRAATRLSAAKVGEICNQTVAVLTEAVALGGSTLVDTQYVGLDGSYGGYQDEHLAYGREDEPCLTCASVGREKLIKRIQVAGRSTFFCPFCQR